MTNSTEGFLLLAQVEPSIVDDVALFHDVGTHGKITSRGVLTDLLKASVVVGVGSGSEAFEHALLGEEKSANVHGENGALLGRILLLEVNVLCEETKRLGFVLEHVEDALAAWNDDDIKVLQLLIGVVVVHVGLDGEALDGRHGS